jgi:hypothetical protein
VSSPIRGPEIDVHQQRTTEVNPSVESGWAGASVGSWSKSKSSTTSQSWRFTSRSPSAESHERCDGTKVAFNWSRGEKADHTGDDLKFRTAIVLSRNATTQINVRVQVQAQPDDLRHQVLRWHSHRERTGGMHPDHNADAAEFEKIVEGLRDQLMKANNVQPIVRVP